MWNIFDHQKPVNDSESLLKNFQKDHSTLMSSRILQDEGNEFQNFLLENSQHREERTDFLSENNSLIDLKFDNFREEKKISDSQDFFSFKYDTLTQIPGGDQFYKTKSATKSIPKRKKKISKQVQACKCKNSNCLRLHCSCFKELGHCGPSCRCRNCLNTKEFQEARDFVINKTKTIYRKAFEEKHVIIKGVKINKDGCNCSKNCENKYCGCKKINGQCSPICRCSSCKNNKIHLTKEEIQTFYKPCSRKKDKIIINYKKGAKTNTQPKKQKIIYKTYKKTKSSF